MIMMVMLFSIWGLDFFVLMRRDSYFLNSFSHRMQLFWLSISSLFFLLLACDILSFKIFSGILFVSLSGYLFSRNKIQNIFSADAYCADRGKKRGFLIFSVSGLSLVWFWGVMVLSLSIRVLGGVFPVFESKLGGASILSFLGGILMVVLIFHFHRRAPAYSLKDLFGLSRKKSSVIKEWVLPILLGVVVSTAVSLLIVSRSHHPVTPFSELLDWAEFSWAIILFLFAAIVAAPFLEEIVFRGFFFKMIQEAVNRKSAFLIVTLSFGVLHMEQYWGDWVGITVIFVLGFLLTALRYFFGSARPAIVLHYTFNGLMVIIPAILFTAAHPIFVEYHMNKTMLSLDEQGVMLRQSIKEDPENAMAYNELAWLYLDSDGDLNDALTMIDRALVMTPERTIFQHTRSEILYEMGRIQEAIEILEYIHQQMPENFDISDRLSEMKHENDKL